MAAKEPVYTHSFRYPIQDLKPGETVLEKFPALAIHSDLVQYGFGANDYALRYAIFLGEGSGLHKAIPDYMARKAEALRLSGIKPTDPRYQGAFDLTDKTVQEVRFAWLRRVCSMEFAEWAQLVERYYQNLAKVGKPIPEDTEGLKETDVQRSYALCTDLVDTLKPLRKDIKELEEVLFYGDEDMKKLAAEKARPQAASGSIESLVFGK